MKLSTSEVARTFDVDREVVKKWTYHFKEYLSEGANPSKGSQRWFIPGDLRVFAYIFYYWEDEPDFVNITAGLDAGEHLGERYDAMFDEYRPIFEEPPDYLNEDCRHGSLMGGMVEDLTNHFTLAESYKLAGDTLVESLCAGLSGYEIARPILFCYRHAIELYLKSVSSNTTAGIKSGKSGHVLAALLSRLELRLKDDFSTSVPKWFRDTILAFDEYDKFSLTFRYAEGIASTKTNDAGEFWIDYYHVKARLSLISKAIKQVRKAFKIPDR